MLVKFVIALMLSFIFCSSFFGLLICRDLLKKLLFLDAIQSVVILLYLLFGYCPNCNSAPIYKLGDFVMTNPVPQVLMLTAIVVGFATSCVGFALILKIKDSSTDKNK